MKNPSVALRGLWSRVRHTSVAKYGFASLIPRGFAIVTALFLTPLAISKLGVVGFGFWVLATQIPNVIASPDLGLTQGLINELRREHGAEGGLRKLRDRLFEVQKLVFGIAFVWMILGVGGGLLYASVTTEAQEFTILAAALVISVVIYTAAIPAMVWTRAQLAQERGHESVLYEGVGKASALVFSILVLLIAPNPLYLVVAFMLPITVTSWLNAIRYSKREFQGLPPRAKSRRMGTIARANIPLFRKGSLFVTMQIASLINAGLDPYFVGWLADTAAVAYVNVGRRPFDALPLVVTLFSPAMWPVFARLAEDGEGTRLGRMFRSLIVTSFVALTVLSLVLIVAREPVFGYLGGGQIMPSASDLTAIAVIMIATTHVTLVSTLLNALDKLRQQAVVLVIGAVCALAVKAASLVLGGVSEFLWTAAATQVLFVALPMTVVGVVALRGVEKRHPEGLAL